MSNSAPRTVDHYLEQLRGALTGEDKAVIQDALYDAEEYLRAEVAQNPDKSEADVLELISSTYGAPGEVADAYRNTEATVQAALATPARREYESVLGRFFGVFADPRAYSCLFYMLLSLATGIIYFTITVTGISMSVGLMILIIGIPFLLLFLGLERVLALVEGRLVETTLGVRMPRRPTYLRRERPFLERIKDMVTDVRTWTTLLYMLLMLPLGVLYFTVAVTGLSVSLGLIFGPIARVLAEIGLLQIQGDVQPDIPMALLPLVMVLGVILLTVLMHLFKGIGSFHGAVAKGLLVQSPSIE